MNYTPPEPIGKPFKTGETVEVCDRDLNVMSQVRVPGSMNFARRSQYGGYRCNRCEGSKDE